MRKSLIIITCMPLTCSPRTGSFNTRIEGDSAGGEFNFPDRIIDLGSATGVAISRLAEGADFSRVLPKLDFYARFLEQFFTPKITITTICVVFDGEAQPFWFGASLGGDKINKPKDMQTRQDILTLALENRGITLPVVPPCHQRMVGMYIRSLVYDILKKGDHRLPDNKEVAELCVELLRAITRPCNNKKQPWEVVPAEPDGFGDTVEKIFKEAGGSATDFVGSLPFDNLKKSIEAATARGAGQQYGHCAETYPLLFMFRFVSLFPKLSMEVSLISLHRKKESTPSKYQGLARSVSQFKQCLGKFYAGPTGIACNGSGKCKMKCAGGGECVRNCGGCQTRCEGGAQCTSVCKQNAGCQTRCYGEGGCETTGPQALCEKRGTRCEVCQKGKEECPEEKNEKKGCWRRVCERCMDSQACCSDCDIGPPQAAVSEAVVPADCLQCGDFMPPCENCQALVDKLEYKNWNGYLKGRHQRLPVSDYMM